MLREKKHPGATSGVLDDDDVVGTTADPTPGAPRAPAPRSHLQIALGVTVGPVSRRDAGGRLISPDAWRRVVVELLDEPAWKLDDALWFALHPDRRFRLRPAFPGEAAARGVAEGAMSHALVRQVEPGKRLVIKLSDPGRHAGCDDDRALEAQFERTIEAMSAGGEA